MSNMNIINILDTIQVMKQQEETIYEKMDYLIQPYNHHHNHSQSQFVLTYRHHEHMIRWCYKVLQFCNKAAYLASSTSSTSSSTSSIAKSNIPSNVPILLLQKDTIEVAMNYMVRYMNSTNRRNTTSGGTSMNVTMTEWDYVVCCVTCYYMAVKINDPMVIDLPLVEQLCIPLLESMDGFLIDSDSTKSITKQDIIQMEQNILIQLQYYLHPPTSMSFVRLCIEYLREIFVQTMQMEMQQLLPTFLRIGTDDEETNKCQEKDTYFSTLYTILSFLPKENVDLCTKNTNNYNRDMDDEQQQQQQQSSFTNHLFMNMIQKQIDYTLCHYEYVSYPPSIIAYCVLMNTIQYINTCNKTQYEYNHSLSESVIFQQISERLWETIVVVPSSSSSSFKMYTNDSVLVLQQSLYNQVVVPELNQYYHSQQRRQQQQQKQKIYEQQEAGYYHKYTKSNIFYKMEQLQKQVQQPFQNQIDPVMERNMLMLSKGPYKATKTSSSLLRTNRRTKTTTTRKNNNHSSPTSIILPIPNSGETKSYSILPKFSP